LRIIFLMFCVSRARSTIKARKMVLV
jgi:hypothetical protein